ncbi:Uncharacterised protein g4699 [Pycnogonum litorale]
MEKQIIPHSSFHIDASVQILFSAFKNCLTFDNTLSREHVTSQIINLIKLENGENRNHSFYPCLSVRTALDAFFSVQKYPAGCEVIISAVTIPDIIRIVRHHGLLPVPLDIDYSTLSANVEDLEMLITKKTVVVIFAHLYGRRIETSELVQTAKRHNLLFIEDCAQSFYDLKNMGDSLADLSLYSFGLLKSDTAFGGAIMACNSDDLFRRIVRHLSTYHLQTQSSYLYKILKYFLIYLVLDVSQIAYVYLKVALLTSFDYKSKTINMMRGFNGDLFQSMRRQPCLALLRTLYIRLSEIDVEKKEKWRFKCDYAIGRLPAGVGTVGMKVKFVNYWLFPVLVDDPKLVEKFLDGYGLVCSRGATQLQVVKPSCHHTSSENNVKNNNANTSTVLPSCGCKIRYPYNGKYMMDHVLYLPINVNVPYESIDYILWALSQSVHHFSRRSKSIKLVSKL